MNTNLNFRASSYPRYVLCPGSAQAEAGLPDGPSSPEASAGDRVHAHLKWWLQSRLKLVGWSDATAPEIESDDEAAFCSRCEQQLTDLMAAHGGASRVWIEGRMISSRRSGQPDALIKMRDTTIHLIDYKSGWLAVDAPNVNAQLRVYAVLSAELWPDVMAAGLYAHILGRRDYDPVYFAPSFFAAAEPELRAIEADCEKPDAPRTPSPDACRYCKARGLSDRCPESAGLPEQFYSLAPKEVGGVALIPGPQLARLYGLWKMIAPMGEEVKEELKRRLKDQPGGVEGYTLAPTGKTRTVSAADFFERAVDLNESLVFDALGRVSVSKIETTLKKAGMDKQAAKGWVADHFAGCIAEEEKDPKIVEVKE